MADTLISRPNGDLRSFFASLLPRNLSLDPLGIFAGFAAYRLYMELDAKTDRELEGMGIARTDIAQVAMDSISQK
ncbi:hypothetical protein BV394_04650 [Brevirhabdus pacifica]|uniref:Uncharacterized protein n=1 Tax=Brevirhabdus pacifica TaxID=1267768 RepID=A0A1U7DGJ7_9RHOB|nr:hypothetical protein [Brevirhabdus pacifica]APX89096.1 hypothetical protein BV394_04650 [Brevirhabdus pacifica]OWU76843.1 hypothetical protein ATO5_11640 [Loktanella sp. 22II-4b]PJJ86322.1 hypothetical protein CLV77_0861 [Brevirhabdus pacifica]